MNQEFSELFSNTYQWKKVAGNRGPEYVRSTTDSQGVVTNFTRRIAGRTQLLENTFPDGSTRYIRVCDHVISGREVIFNAERVQPWYLSIYSIERLTDKKNKQPVAEIEAEISRILGLDGSDSERSTKKLDIEIHNQKDRILLYYEDGRIASVNIGKIEDWEDEYDPLDQNPGENLRQLYSLYRLDGETVLYPEVILDPDNRENAIAQQKKYLVDYYREKSSRWDEKTKDEIQNLIFQFLEGMIVREVPDLLEDPSGADFFFDLVLNILAGASEDFDLGGDKKRRELAWDALSRGLEASLIIYKTNVSCEGQTSTQINLGRLDEGRLSFNAMNGFGETILKEERGLGEEFRYSEMIYRVDLDDNQKLRILFSNVLYPSLTSQIIIGTYIDDERIRELLKRPTTLDWVEVFDLVPASFE